MTPTLLVDGDQFLYKATAALETEIRWDEQNHVLYSNAEEAWDVFEGSIKKLCETLGSDKVYLAFTGSRNFRKEVYPPYKAARKAVRKPLCYGRLYERAQEAYTCKSVDGLEADDLMGIWATSGKFKNPIIVSDDKDMQTIPCALYRQDELSEVDRSAADYYWLFQTLTGDTTDGYPGCPGVGKVKAEKLLGEFWTLDENNEWSEFLTEPAWEAVVRTYEAAGLTYDDALTQARVARILRASDWDSKKKEPILWKP